MLHEFRKKNHAGVISHRHLKLIFAFRRIERVSLQNSLNARQQGLKFPKKLLASGSPFVQSAGAQKQLVAQASRRRSNCRLIADWLRKQRFAARVTWRSSSSTARWTSRSRSSLLICG